RMVTQAASAQRSKWSHEMETELEKAIRAAAKRKVEAGVEPRDPVAAGLRFEQRQAFPRNLIALIAACVLVIVLVAVSELVAIPAAHIISIGLLIGVAALWFRGKRRR